MYCVGKRSFLSFQNVDHRDCFLSGIGLHNALGSFLSGNICGSLVMGKDQKQNIELTGRRFFSWSPLNSFTDSATLVMALNCLKSVHCQSRALRWLARSAVGKLSVPKGIELPPGNWFGAQAMGQVSIGIPDIPLRVLVSRFQANLRQQSQVRSPEPSITCAFTR